MNNVGGLIALTVTHRAKLSAFFSQSRAEGERERFEVTRIEAERSQPFHRANNASMYVCIRVRAPRVEIFSVGWKRPWNELIASLIKIFETIPIDIYLTSPRFFKSFESFSR